MTKKNTDGLALLREPFPDNQISKLPKPTKQQTEAVKADFKNGHRCKICGGWHHPKVVHLDYVGHAALTDRLLNCDPQWNWEPAALNASGAPLLDDNGGMWIKLTVCGQTRLGYGHPDGKRGGDAVKETIGDALRNAGMRFGAALDLWHKGELHIIDDDPKSDDAPKKTEQQHREQAAYGDKPDLPEQVKGEMEVIKDNIKRISESGTKKELEEFTKTDRHSNLMQTLYDGRRDLHDWMEAFVTKSYLKIDEREAFPGDLPSANENAAQ